MIKGMKNSYCQTCEIFYDGVLILICPKCKERLVETYHLQKDDIMYSTGCFLQWNGKRFLLGGMEGDAYFDGEYVMFDEYDNPFIIMG